MARPTSKTDLIQQGQSQFQQLMTLIDSLSDQELQTEFDFTSHLKKKEAHWKRDKNLRDILIHLYEWHQLILNWVDINSQGGQVTFLPAPYNWKTYGEMNIKLWQKHQNTSLDEAMLLFKESHLKVIQLAETFSNEQLFQKDIYPWVGGSTLGSYFVSTTASHYDWAIKKLKAHRKNCQDEKR